MMDSLRRAIVTSETFKLVNQAVSRAPRVKALLRPLARLLLPASGQVHAPIATGLAKGLVIQVDPRFSQAYLQGDYEPWFQALIQDSLRPGATYVDVGAHTGFFVLCAARLVGTQGQIFALEPDPANFANLMRNIELNSLSQVEALHIAAWSSRTTLSLVRAGKASGLSEGRVSEQAVRGGDSPESSWATSGVPLDEVVAEVLGLIKIDVEGAEMDVLAGANRLLSAKQSVWAVECHTRSLAESVEKTFQSLGYVVERVGRPDTTGRDWTQIHVVARPRHRRPRKWR
jgi:FkbM family methyltransferase